MHHIDLLKGLSLVIVLRTIFKKKWIENHICENVLKSYRLAFWYYWNIDVVDVCEVNEECDIVTWHWVL